MRLSILVFDGMTTLDAIGGYEVLSRIPGMETEFVGARRGIIAVDTRRLGLLAFRDFSEVSSTDILYVPGGPGGIPLETNEPFLEYVRKLDRTSTWTVGICNGVMLLAAAGLLKGHKATTNWFCRDRLKDWGAEFVPERYHRAGKYITGAGVSASIDTGFFLAQIIAGEAFAKTVQLGIEYYPSPPFSERSPTEAPPDAYRRIEKMEASGGGDWRSVHPPFEGSFQVLS